MMQILINSPTDIVVRSVVQLHDDLPEQMWMIREGSLRPPENISHWNKVFQTDRHAAPFVFGLPSDHGSLNLHSDLASPLLFLYPNVLSRYCC